MSSRSVAHVTPLIGVSYNPRETHLFLAFYRGEKTPFISGRGPPCRWWFQIIFYFHPDP